MATKSKQYSGTVTVCQIRTMKDAFSHEEANVKKMLAFLMVGMNTDEGQIWFYSPKSKYTIHSFPSEKKFLEKNPWTTLLGDKVFPLLGESDKITIRGIIERETKFGTKLKMVKLLEKEIKVENVF